MPLLRIEEFSLQAVLERHLVFLGERRFTRLRFRIEFRLVVVIPGGCAGRRLRLYFLSGRLHAGADRRDGLSFLRHRGCQSGFLRMEKAQEFNRASAEREAQSCMETKTGLAAVGLISWRCWVKGHLHERWR